MAEREEEKLRQFETDLAAYRREIEKPFEHEARLRELELKQAELNSELDLHKSDLQALTVSLRIPGQGERDSGTNVKSIPG